MQINNFIENFIERTLENYTQYNFNIFNTISIYTFSYTFSYIFNILFNKFLYIVCRSAISQKCFTHKKFLIRLYYQIKYFALKHDSTKFSMLYVHDKAHTRIHEIWHRKKLSHLAFVFLMLKKFITSRGSSRKKNGVCLVS